MGKYDIRLLPAAFDDIDALYLYIAGELFAPATADRYVTGIYNIIGRLSRSADVFAVSTNEYVQKLYGPGARTVVYKKMTIIYNIIDRVVLIRRIMPGSMIP
jgi:plasmid stabilization system protein ParE